MLTRENRVFLSATTFALGSSVIVAAAAYGGDLLPSSPPASASAYDKSGYYVELGIWFVAVVAGLLLLRELLTRKK
jgi:hypothetical protein